MLSAAGGGSEDEAKKEVQKARREGSSPEKLASDKSVTKKSGITVAREIFRENGTKGLFRGGILRGIWTALGSGLYLGMYESSRVWLGDRHDSEEAQ